MIAYYHIFVYKVKGYCKIFPLVHRNLKNCRNTLLRQLAF